MSSARCFQYRQRTRPQCSVPELHQSPKHRRRHPPPPDDPSATRRLSPHSRRRHSRSLRPKPRSRHRYGRRRGWLPQRGCKPKRARRVRRGFRDPLPEGRVVPPARSAQEPACQVAKVPQGEPRGILVGSLRPPISRLSASVPIGRARHPLMGPESIRNRRMLREIRPRESPPSTHRTSVRSQRKTQFLQRRRGPLPPGSSTLSRRFSASLTPVSRPRRAVQPRACRSFPVGSVNPPAVRNYRNRAIVKRRVRGSAEPVQGFPGVVIESGSFAGPVVLDSVPRNGSGRKPRKTRFHPCRPNKGEERPEPCSI